MLTRNFKYLLSLPLGASLLFACGNLTPSIQKSAMADRERAEAAQAELDAKAKHARGADAPASGADASTASTAVSESVPAENAAASKADADAPAVVAIQIRTDLRKNRGRNAKAASADAGTEVIGFDTASTTSLRNSEEAIAILPKKELPAKFVAVLTIYVDSLSDRNALKNADLAATLEESERTGAKKYALRLDRNDDLDDLARSVLAKADFTLEWKPAAEEIPGLKPDSSGDVN